MDETEPFIDFLSRLCAHDEAAAVQFVLAYAPELLHVIGGRLHKLGLSALLDPEDITQMVFMKFFAAIDVQQFNLAGPRDLVKLLVTMTNNIIKDEQRHAHARRRGGSHHVGETADVEYIPSRGEEPSHDLEIEDELNQIHHLLSEEDWHLAVAWASGETWQQIAAELGQSAESLRKRFNRAADRVRVELIRKRSRK